MKYFVMKKFNHICINYTKYNIYTCISINATNGRLTLLRDIRNILYLNTTYIDYFIRIHLISLTQILKRIDICYCMTNCCDIIYNIVFIFAMKTQPNYLNMWVCQYLNKLATIFKYGAKLREMSQSCCVNVSR